MTQTAETRTDVQVWEMIAGQLKGLIDTPIDEAKVRDIVKEEVATRVPREVVVKLADGAENKLDREPHACFGELLALVEEGVENILMVGPAGSGKTQLAESIAQALGVPFGFLSLSGGVTETHILGRVLPQADGSWEYQRSLFVKIYEEGGVFLLDEIDAADPNVMVSINAALANGVMANPNGSIHKRHRKCLIIAAANTWGRGGDRQYVGRNALDAATLDRFTLATVNVDYDRALEERIATSFLDEEQARVVLDWVWHIRDSVREKRLRRVASTRLVERASRALARGRDIAQVRTRFFMGWSADELAKVGD